MVTVEAMHEMRGMVLVSAFAILQVFFMEIVLAGTLDPPGPPAPTMRSLEQVTPSWDRVLPANNGGVDGCNSSRFTCVMGRAEDSQKISH